MSFDLTWPLQGPESPPVSGPGRTNSLCIAQQIGVNLYADPEFLVARPAVAPFWWNASGDVSSVSVAASADPGINEVTVTAGASHAYLLQPLMATPAGGGLSAALAPMWASGQVKGVGGAGVRVVARTASLEALSAFPAPDVWTWLNVKHDGAGLPTEPLEAGFRIEAASTAVLRYPSARLGPIDLVNRFIPGRWSDGSLVGYSGAPKVGDILAWRPGQDLLAYSAAASLTTPGTGPNTLSLWVYLDGVWTSVLSFSLTAGVGGGPVAGGSVPVNRFNESSGPGGAYVQVDAIDADAEGLSVTVEAGLPNRPLGQFLRRMR